MYQIEPENISYHHYNERDIEIPTLLKSVEQSLPKINSFLDVGAWYSFYHYASQLAELLGPERYYAGVDIQSCKKTEMILDDYFIGNVLDVSLKQNKWSYVSCVSTIEHCGLSTYKKEDFREEQTKVFKQLLALSSYKVFLSFPFGLDDVYPKEYANITDDMLARWKYIANNFGFTNAFNKQFWFNEFPQGKEKWLQISKGEAAEKPMVPEKGTQCVCLVEFTKKDI